MRKYIYTKYKINPPSHIPNYSKHDCRVEHCWETVECQEHGGSGECFITCPFAIIQYCMVCDAPAYIGYSLDYESQRKDKLGYKKVTTIPFWTCDKHWINNNLEKVLKDGIPVDIADGFLNNDGNVVECGDNKNYLIEYVRKKLDILVLEEMK